MPTSVTHSLSLKSDIVISPIQFHTNIKMSIFLCYSNQCNNLHSVWEGGKEWNGMKKKKRIF